MSGKPREAPGMSRVTKATLAILVLAISGCASTPTKEQEYAYRAIETCKATGGQQDINFRVYPDGAISLEGRADGASPVLQCLKRFGYNFN